jgi:hypothetical protein
LVALKRANAHFSDDLLSSLLNEPIPGHGIFWSSVGGKPYPVSIRALSFERVYPLRDPAYSRAPGDTYARQLRDTFEHMMAQNGDTPPPPHSALSFPGPQPDSDEESDAPLDVMARLRHRALEAFRANRSFQDQLRSTEGMPWFRLQKFFMEELPEELEDRRDFAYSLVPHVLNAVFGNRGWESYKNPRTAKTWIRVKARG